MGFNDRNRLIDEIDRNPGKRRAKGSKSRRRFRTDTKVVKFRTYHSTHHGPPTGTVTLYYDKQATYFTYYELMNDIVGDNGGEHPADHVKVTSTCGSRRAFEYSIASSPPQSGGSPMGPWESIEFGHIHQKVPVIVHTSLGDQSLRALKRAAELFPTEVLVPNFIYELKDWRSLPKVIANLKRGWESFRLQNLGAKAKVAREVMLWLTGKRPSSLLLAKQFALDPFLRDAKKLFSICDKFDKQITFLKSKVGKRYMIGHREELSVPGGFMSDSGIGTTVLTGEYYRAVVNYSFQVSHDIPELDSLQSRVRVAMGMLGLDNPAAVIWEAIPYSFLVDWFVDVQGMFERLGDLPFLKGRITVHKAHTSVLQRASIGHYALIDGKRIYLDRYNLRRYWRLPGVPSQSLVALKTALNDNQLLLVAALLRQRV